MKNDFSIKRFVTIQRNMYPIALSEIRNGKKTSHWMWFIFPQLKVFGNSKMAKIYGISGIEEARAYLKNNTLYNNLIEICEALMNLEDCDPVSVFNGSIDARKLKSCMTLFSEADSCITVFNDVINKYFDGHRCSRTLEILRK